MHPTREDLVTARTERSMLAHLIAELVVDGQPVSSELVVRFVQARARYQDLWHDFMNYDTPERS